MFSDKIKYLVFFVFITLSVDLCLGQNANVQKIESSISAMSQSPNIADLKQKYQVAIQQTETSRGRLGASVMESRQEELRLTKKMNEEYYKRFIYEVNTYLKGNPKWSPSKISEIKADFKYVYEKTINPGYVTSYSVYTTLENAIKQYEEVQQYIARTKPKMRNASLENLQKIKEETIEKINYVGNHSYLSKNAEIREELNNIIGDCGSEFDRRSRLELSQTDLDFASEGGTQYITVKSESNWVLQGVDASMISVNRESGRIEVRCAENSDFDSRTSRFVVDNGYQSVTVLIYQDAKQEDFSVSSSSLSFSSSSGTKYIRVYGSSNWNLASTRSSMMSVDRDGDSIRVICYKNTSTLSRNSYFEIVLGTKKQRINVYQEAYVKQTLVLSSNSLSFPVNEDIRIIDVRGCYDWYLKNVASEWMTVQKSGNQIIVRAQTNNKGKPRQDYFDVVCGDDEKRVHVSQIGSGTNTIPNNRSNITSNTSSNEGFSVSPKSVSISPEGGVSYLTVSGSSNWHLKNWSSPWMEVTRSGNHISVKAPSNTGKRRDDWFIVEDGDKRITVNVSQNEYSRKSHRTEKSRGALRYHTFLLPVMGFSQSMHPSVGLMIGGVKRAGWFIKVRSDFSEASNFEYKSNTNVTDGYFLSDDCEKSDLSITGGLSVRLGKSPLCLNLGGGYENRMVLQKTLNDEWIRNDIDSHKGFVVEGAFLFLIRRTEQSRCRASLSAGYSTILSKESNNENKKSNYGTFEFGVGLNF